MEDPLEEELETIAMRMFAIVGELIQIGTHEVGVSCSIGIANYSCGTETAASMYGRADQAMFRPKRQENVASNTLLPDVRFRAQASDAQSGPRILLSRSDPIGLFIVRRQAGITWSSQPGNALLKTAHVHCRRMAFLYREGIVGRYSRGRRYHQQIINEQD